MNDSFCLKVDTMTASSEVETKSMTNCARALRTFYNKLYLQDFYSFQSSNLSLLNIAKIAIMMVFSRNMASLTKFQITFALLVLIF